MSERHALASEGAWVELRDPKELKAGAKRTLMRTIGNPETVTAGSIAIDMTDGLIMLLVENWELPTQIPVPTTLEGWRQALDMMEIGDYDQLMELVGPAQELLFGSKKPEATPEQRADPASPTTPSDA